MRVNKQSSSSLPKRELPLPEPSMGLQAYRKERDLAFVHDPRRKENYEKYLATRRTGAKVDYIPIKLDIENVSRCNFRCTMCQVSGWKGGKRSDDLPLHVFKALLDQQYGVYEIKIQGMGEPTIQGNPYFDMVRYARSSHIWVRTITNGSLLHWKDTYKSLIDADPNEVQISIDGASKSVYEGIRRGGKFEQVTSNCKLINAYCKENGLRRTKMWTVVQESNRHQLAQLVELAAEIGFRDLVFSLEVQDWGQSEWTEKNSKVSVGSYIQDQELWKLVELGKRNDVKVSFWKSIDKYSANSVETLCPWPFERAYISSDQRVVPCCMIANPNVSELGGAEDFTKTWNSKKFEEFRKAHLEGNIPAVCKGCYQCN